MVKKFSVTYVKQHPFMFGAIFLVFGLFLWMLLNKGTSGGSVASTTVVTPGPSDAQVAAGVALQQAQLGAQTQLGLAQLSLAANQQNNASQENLAAMALTAQMAQIQSDHDLNNQQIAASVEALQLQLGSNLALTHDNNQFMLDYAKNAQDAATAQLMIGANLQAELGRQSLEGFKFASAASIIPTLKKGKRDNAFFALTGTTDEVAMAKLAGGGSGGFNPLSLAGGAVGAFTNIAG